MNPPLNIPSNPSFSTPSFSTSSIITAVATLLTTYILKRYKFDTFYYGMIFMLLVQSLEYFSNFKISNITNIDFFTNKIGVNGTGNGMGNGVGNEMGNGIMGTLFVMVTAVVVVAVGFACRKIYLKSKILFTIEFHSPYDVAKMFEFLKYAPEILDCNSDNTKGLLQLEKYYQQYYKDMKDKITIGDGYDFVQQIREYFIPQINTDIPFNIKDIELSGYFHVTYEKEAYTHMNYINKNQSTEEKRCVFLISIALKITKNPQKMNAVRFNEYIHKYIIKKKRDGQYIELTHRRTLPSRDDRLVTKRTSFYDGLKRSCDELEKIWIEPFFHPEKDRLWGLIKTIHTNPEYLISIGQSPRANFLFHGPPGTGKSSFAYRIAMTLQYSIFSIDIRHLPNRKEFEDAFQYEQCLVETKGLQNTIFILDEFDQGVCYLYNIEETRQKEKENLQKQIEYTCKQLQNTETDLDSFYTNAIAHARLTNVTVKNANNEITNNKIENSETKSSETIKNSEPIKNNENNETKRNVKKRNYSGKMETDTLTYMLRFASEQAKELAKESDEVTLKDLLNVLQGPVPKDGLLIFATTNEYDKIYRMCPALFRHSRMTPIHFGYCEKKTIYDIYAHYFKKEPTFYVPEQTLNSSAEIIQYAIECLWISGISTEEKFQRFDSLINKNIRNAY